MGTPQKGKKYYEGLDFGKLAMSLPEFVQQNLYLSCSQRWWAADVQ
jgi:hypothetical protein